MEDPTSASPCSSHLRSHFTIIEFAFIISYQYFKRDDVDEDPLNGRAGVIKLVEDERVDLGKKSETEDNEAGVDVSDGDLFFLLKDVEEVENMKIVLEGSVNSYEPSTATGPEQQISDVEAAILTKLAGSVNELLASDVSVDEQVIDIDGLSGDIYSNMKMLILY